MLELFGFLVLCAGATWYTLLCYAIICYGGLDLSPFWSIYYNQIDKHNRIKATAFCAVCVGIWYFLYTISPIGMIIK